MQTDYDTAGELGYHCFLRGTDRVDTYSLLQMYGYHRYPKKKARAARDAFIDWGMRKYDRWHEIDPKGFGRLKGNIEHGYKEKENN